DGATVESVQGGDGDTANHDEQTYRLVLQEYFAQHQHGKRTQPDGQAGRVRFAEVLEEMSHADPETALAALETEELWQLRARQIERHAGLETDQNRFRNEVDDGAGFDQP